MAESGDRETTEEGLRQLLQREQAARAEAEAAGAMFRGLLESAPDGIFIVDRSGRILLVNGQTEQMFGYRREELLGQPVELLLPERFREAHVGHRSRYQASPRTRPMGAGLHLCARRKDGSELPVEISLSPLETQDGPVVTGIIRDISDRRQAEQERADLLAREREKSEQLKLSIREAHHRIKNNLQAVSDLLYLEFTAEDAADPGEALRSSMERIQAIALVHDLLSQEQDVQTVDARAVIAHLVPMVLRGGSVAPESLTLDLQVAPVSLPSRMGTALALILNELVSNAVKHVFARRLGSCLSVSLQPAGEGLQLSVKDDGPGLPPGFDLEQHGNVGLQVVHTLAERDLGGRLLLRCGTGLVAELWIPCDTTAEASHEPEDPDLQELP
jgi:two-component system, sensor histidine kinase PdtaS